MRWGGQVLEYPYFSKYYSKPKAFILNKLKDFFKSKKIGI